MHDGEVGDTVLYVCPGGGAHNAANAVCDPNGGDVHPAIVAEVLTRDAEGKPAQALLALVAPRLPTLQWVTAQHAPRTPGEGPTIWRISRGSPPLESCSQPGPSIEHVLDFPLGTWHKRGE